MDMVVKYELVDSEVDWKLVEQPGLWVAKSPVGGQSLVLYHSLILGPQLFYIFNDDLDTEAAFTLSKSSDDAKWGGLAVKSGGCSAVRRDPQQTGEFGRGEPHEVLQQEALGTWEWITLCTTTHWGLIDWKAALQSRILVWVTKMNMNQQCTLAAKLTNNLLACIR